MRTLLFLMTTLLIFSCGKDDIVETCTDVALGQSVVLSNNDLVCIDDIEYTFKADDSRCPCDTVCAWEGEFIMTFEQNGTTTVFTYHSSPTMPSDDPIIGENLSISIEAPSDCGNESEIDEVMFTVLFE